MRRKSAEKRHLLYNERWHLEKHRDVVRVHPRHEARHRPGTFFEVAL